MALNEREPLSKSEIQPRRKAVTQRDVAKRAGVSIATVSRVINGVSTVEAEIREKVERAIVELGYRPNEVARSLRVDKTYTIGMVAPEISNPYAMEVASGAQKVLRRHGYAMMISGSESNPKYERRNLKTMMDKRVDGLLVTPVSPDSSELERLAEQIPVVLIDFVNSERLDSVRVDNIEGAFHAVAHLVTRGYKRIATIAGPQRYTADRERLEGYQRAMEFYGLEVPDEYIRIGDFFVEGGYRECRELLRECPDVEAIFTASNLTGIGALRAIKELGLRIPDDVALCIFDDFLMADMAAPPLTVLAQPTIAIGETAARMLLDRIRGRRVGPPRHVLLKPELIVREST